MATQAPGDATFSTNNLQDLDNRTECVGCKKPLFALVLKCGHMLHKACGFQLKENGYHSCSLCNQRITHAYPANYDATLSATMQSPCYDSKTHVESHQKEYEAYADHYFPFMLLQGMCENVQYLFPGVDLGLTKDSTPEELIAALKKHSDPIQILGLHALSTEEEIFSAIHATFGDVPAVAKMRTYRGRVNVYLKNILINRIQDECTFTRNEENHNHDDPNSDCCKEKHKVEAADTPSKLLGYLHSKKLCLEIADKRWLSYRSFLVPLHKVFPETLGGIIPNEANCFVCQEKLTDGMAAFPYRGIYTRDERGIWHPECYNPGTARPDSKVSTCVFAFWKNLAGISRADVPNIFLPKQEAPPAKPADPLPTAAELAAEAKLRASLPANWTFSDVVRASDALRAAANNGTAPIPQASTSAPQSAGPPRPSATKSQTMLKILAIVATCALTVFLVYINLHSYAGKSAWLWSGAGVMVLGLVGTGLYVKYKK